MNYLTVGNQGRPIPPARIAVLMQLAKNFLGKVVANGTDHIVVAWPKDGDEFWAYKKLVEQQGYGTEYHYQEAMPLTANANLEPGVI